MVGDGRAVELGTWQRILHFFSGKQGEAIKTKAQKLRKARENSTNFILT